MSKKITLTVPDALYNKINDWRSSFNMSRIFQEAVSEAIHRKEEFIKRMDEDSGLSEIIERLRSEKSSLKKSLFSRAEKEGHHWAARAHYEDLLAAVSATPEQVMSLPNLELTLNSSLEKLGQRSSNMEFEYFRSTVLSGWKKGVNDFWEMVKDKV